jgi:choice-of-anchor C domain-containing protein
MRRRSIAGAIIAALASLSLAGSVLGFSGVSNGSFETGAFTGAPWDTLLPGSANITGWTVEAGSVDWIGGYWPASDGSRSIDLSGDGPGAISQTLATTISNTYSVSFDLSGNPTGGPAIKTLTVSATGAPTESFTYDTSIAGNTLKDMKWEARTYSFVATTTTTTLTLTSTTAGNAGPAIDNIVVTETLPPSDTEPVTRSDCKADGWLSVVDRDGNQFKNQGDCVSYVASGQRNPGAVTP